MSNKFKIRFSDFKVIKWLLNIGKSQIYKMIVIIIVNALGAAFSVVFASLSKNIIDGATVFKDVNYVVKYAVYLLLLIVLEVILGITSKFLVEKCKGKLEIIYKRLLLSEIIKKDYSSITKYHSGELQNRMFNDVSIVAGELTSLVPSIVFLVVKLVGAFTYLVVIDKFFAFLLLIGGALMFFVMALFKGVMKSLHKKVQETEGKTRSFIQEVITNLLVIKSFVVGDKVLKNVDELQDDNYNAKMKRCYFTISASAGMSAIFNLGSLFALFFGAVRILMNKMTYGTVMAIIQLVNQVQAPFANLSSIVTRYYSLIASGERIMEICNVENESQENEKAINTEETYNNLKSIEFKNISFGYDRDLVLENANLTINKGDFVAVTGISGIGKSTILKLLLGVFNVQNGVIELNLNDENILASNKTRKLFAYVPQGNMLLSGTIKDNLTFINENATDEEIENAIKISCAKQFIDELPLGLNTVIGEKGSGLSEGQIQRIAIARSLLSKSPILLLDEATSALDEETEKEFLTSLKKIKNITCIIVSHKKATLDICNKIVEIADKKIICNEK